MGCIRILGKLGDYPLYRAKKCFVLHSQDYLTNVTAQIFGAPPDAPQPRNAQAKMPLRSEDEEAPAKGKETAESQVGAAPFTKDPKLWVQICFHGSVTGGSLGLVNV